MSRGRAGPGRRQAVAGGCGGGVKRLRIHDSVAAGRYSLVAVVMRLWLGQELNDACPGGGE